MPFQLLQREHFSAPAQYVSEEHRSLGLHNHQHPQLSDAELFCIFALDFVDFIDSVEPFYLPLFAETGSEMIFAFLPFESYLPGASEPYSSVSGPFAFEPSPVEVREEADETSSTCSITSYLA